MKIEEVTVYSIGDSTALMTWSNVPYFFTETLISKGIKVNRVNLAPSGKIQFIFDNSVVRLLKLFNKNTSYNYFRSSFNYFLTRKKIKGAVKRYSSSQADIFLTFSFSTAGFSNKPCILVCDRTYEHYIYYFLGRNPQFPELGSIRRETRMIESASKMVSLFPMMAEYLRKRYKSNNVYYLDYFINSSYAADNEELLEIKKNSKSILFVGGEYYIDGAISLINTFEKLKEHIPGLSLNIVGLRKSKFQNIPIPEAVNIVGYLNKAKQDERELFHELIRNAKVFVNTTPKWGAYSTCVESMYFYTPIIVNKYDEFVKTFGEQIDFGYYCDENSPDSILSLIKKIFNHPDYQTLCNNAHNAVHDFTWSSYADKILDLINCE